jgi:hypothetical protein
MSRTSTSVQVDTRLVDEAQEPLAPSPERTPVNKALQEVVALGRFKKLMKKYAGKPKFAGHDR